MPKVTFFNLTEEKRANLIEALQKEFSRVPLYEASISNIIKSANIPRGSFYQYFEDKEDAYFFLLNKQLEKSNENFISCLEKCDGDLFETMIEMYQLTLKEIAVDKNLQLLKNAFLNMTHEIEKSFNKVFIAHGNIDHFQKISSLLKITNLNITNEIELFHLMKIIATVTLRNLIEKLAKNVPDSEAMENYKLEINLLKKGLYRNGEEVL